MRSESGRMTEKLTRDMIEAARIIAEETGSFWTDQLNNTDQLAAYHEMAEEIWTQTGGQIDGFVQSVGTAASLRGIAEALRRHDATDQDRRRGARRIPGAVGRQDRRSQDRRRRRGLRRAALAGRTSPIGSSRSPRKRRWPWPLRLAREEGLFAGTSTGANVIAALRLAERLGPGATDRHGHVRYRDEISQQMTSTGRTLLTLAVT